MTEAENGPSIDVTVTLDVSGYPQVTVEISHETKEEMGYKSAILLSRGDQSIGLNALTTTTVNLSFIFLSF